MSELILANERGIDSHLGDEKSEGEAFGKRDVTQVTGGGKGLKWQGVAVKKPQQNRYMLVKF
jgi:hypothetical protein